MIEEVVTRMIVTCVRVIVLPSFMSLSCERMDSGRMEVMVTHDLARAHG